MSLPPGRNLFAEFKGEHRVFVETGTYRGDGIQSALDAGFNLIVSIDIDADSREFCKSRFTPEQRTGRIYLHTDDTAVNLWEYINEINEPILFWLDAHWQYMEGEQRGANAWPLLQELRQIEAHTLKYGHAHTIIIDDILMLTHPNVTGWTREHIEFALHGINCGFKFEYLANPVYNNILVAHV